MPSYRAPVEDLRFVLLDFLKLDQLSDTPGYAEVDGDLVAAVLEGGARIAEDVWQPLNQIGDAQGCRFENGVVRTPEGFKQALEAYYEGGWNALGMSPEWGGQGLPGVLAMAISEMSVAANISLSTYVGLSMGVAGTLMGLAPKALKQRYIPNLVSGRWSGTMNLTEPQCGTDLRLMRTRAVEQDDGSYLITGTKIFITGGEHDMAENIVHLVLAKIPAEGDGLAAVNLFVVPKFLVNDDGTLGPRNGVMCGGIEAKMGLKGSSTAVLNYDNAVGYRLGPRPQAGKGSDGKQKSSARGMSGMFSLMNAARLGVGFQGVALAEVAYQNAAAYAKERRSGRALEGPREPEQEADAIIVHADVRRMLLEIRSFAEGARALAMWLSHTSALGRRSGDGSQREEADDLMNLLTPVIKGYFTDRAFEATNQAMQCFGGHGYVREHGMEQFVRDCRILQLYEGANGVQAMDLVGRKLPANAGRAPQRYFALIDGFIAENRDDAAMQPFTGALAQGLGRLKEASLWLAQNAVAERNHAGAGARDYLHLMGIVALGHVWAQLAQVALAKQASGDGDLKFLETKLNTARFFMARVMPETAALKAKILAGAETVMAPADDAF